MPKDRSTVARTVAKSEPLLTKFSTIPYDTLKRLRKFSGGLVTKLNASSGPSKGLCKQTTWPTVSYPRRPARPAICMNSFEVKLRGPESPRLESADNTLDRAGMFTPAASVSVANTTFSKPRWNSASTKPFQPGSKPAWWLAMPSNNGSIASGLTASGLAS